MKHRITSYNVCYTKLLRVSPATIRNDLRDLEVAGAIERTHGGAMSCQKPLYELNTYQKEDRYVPEKEAIAKTAAEFIQPGDAIALDRNNFV